MKAKYLLLVATGMLCSLAACKKSGDSRANSRLIGKWYENKLVLHQITGSNTSMDTTFTSESFTNQDYFQFNADNTAVISKSGTFSFSGKAIVEHANQPFDFVNHYTYSIRDSLITMTLTDRVPVTWTNAAGSFTTIQSIVQLDAGHLVMHTDIVPQGPTTYPTGLISTAYFTKEK